MLVFPNMAGVAAKNCVHFLLNALLKRGYTCIGPTVRDAAIVYEEIRAEDDLPIGYTDEQDGGTYRLKKRNDAARFGYTVGPVSWKQYLFLHRTMMSPSASGSRHAEAPMPTTKRPWSVVTRAEPVD